MRTEEFSVVFFSCFAVCFVCLFGSVELPKIMSFAVDFYARNKLQRTLIKTRTFIASGVVTLKRFVAMIFNRSSLAKIFPPVVTSIAVDVIDFKNWPSSCHPKPYDTMCKIFFVLNAYFYPALIITSTCVVSYLKPTCQSFFPNQKSSFFVVVKNVSHKIGSQVLTRVFGAALYHQVVIDGSYRVVKC